PSGRNLLPAKCQREVLSTAAGILLHVPTPPVVVNLPAQRNGAAVIGIHRRRGLQRRIAEVEMVVGIWPPIGLLDIDADLVGRVVLIIRTPTWDHSDH